MAKIKKKGTTGQAKNFITRTRAVRKLQISLPDFRRLCIFKGIYPREPQNKRKAAKNATPNTTFYYTKDIQYLLHEPLLQKFRDHHAVAKKVSRALGKGRVQDAARLEKNHAPRMTLDHIIKERYPTFVDALRDLDDCLSMLSLFANLPSHHESVPPKTIELCQRLCLEFQHYLITTHSLRKSFLSIKGIYYQATIQGQDILWLVPYKFVQRITGDVDFRIMGTFIEFYTTLLGFVNYRLYTSAGLVYPPKFNQSSDEAAAELDAFIPQSKTLSSGRKNQTDAATDSAPQPPSKANTRAQSIANSLSASAQSANASASANGNDNENSDDDGDDEDQNQTDFQKQDPQADDLPALSLSSDTQSARAASLFAPYVFYLSRETPRAPLEFLLKAFGCARVGWDAIQGSGAFTTDESDARITHQVVDRPPAPVANGPAPAPATTTKGRFVNRTYVQPQWVWDSANACALQQPAPYAPGATLPPHLSPFVQRKAGQYDPTAPLDEDAARADIDDAQALLRGEQSSDEEDEAEAETSAIAGVDSVKDIADMDASVVEAEADNASFGGFSSDDQQADHADDDDDDEQDEQMAEADSTPKKETAPKKADKKAARAAQEKEWSLERRKMMLPRRKREAYERAAHSRAGRDAETDRLKAKRRRLENKAASAAA